MALITTLRCSCGKEWLIYMPKRMLFREIFRGGGVELGKAIDEHERDRGEVALVEGAAELNGVELRDISVNEIIQCRCGLVIDMLRLITLSVKYPEVSFMQYKEVRIPQYKV